MNALRRLRHVAMRVWDGLQGLTDADAEARTIIRAVEPFTMTTDERLFGLIQAVRHVVRAELPGDFVECGVWRGGSMMAAALALLDERAATRALHLFDTYEGMSAPSENDNDWRGVSASRRFTESKRADGGSSWCHASLEDVRENLLGTGYDPKLVHFVKGKVEDTLPASAPESIALLRLDTDWYESTRHELEQLYPRLVRGGVLIIDDYGWWQGARKATDEYLAANGIKLLLNRLDRTGRIAIKP